MKLRPYQQAAHDAVLEHLRKCDRPVVVDAATGAGKSYIIAALAKTLWELGGGKRVLCLAPSKELVEQNFEKYALTGESASIFCASAGSKCLTHPVVFGSPLSVLNAIEQFAEMKFALVVIDEAHSLTPSIKTIVEKLRAGNKYLRVVGLTATPYRLGEGYIYRQEANGTVYGEETAKAPWFDTCVFKIGAAKLIEQGFLAEPVTLGTPEQSYDTSGLEMNRMHRFEAASVEKAFQGKGRLTAEILAEVQHLARDRKGVLVFAATVQHARECMESLPEGQTALVTGETPQKERAAILRRFKARELKYLVNVSVLTTGFDASHIDVIALLRATESVSLLQQMIGRGLRMDEGKVDVMVLDYAGNIERHCPNGDLFDPKIEAHKDFSSEQIEVKCGFGHSNLVTLSAEGKKHEIDEGGNILDLRKRPILDNFGKHIPGHNGRRCNHVDVRGRRCPFRWVYKECTECSTKNDIAARYCESCKAELVDPNEKLKLESSKLPPRKWITEDVVSVNPKTVTGINGKEHHIAEFKTPTRQFSVFFFPNSEWESTRERYARFKRLHSAGMRQVTYKMDGKGYYRIKL